MEESDVGTAPYSSQLIVWSRQCRSVTRAAGRRTVVTAVTPFYGQGNNSIGENVLPM
jgi:hypothetical protein